MRLSCYYVVAGACALSIQSPAFADAAAEARADALYADGDALMKQGRYTEACGKFQESQSVAPSGGATLNLGECNDKGGKPAQAYGYFLQAIDIAHAAGNTKIEAYAEERASAVRAKVTLVTIDAQTAPGEAVLLDGVPVSLHDWAAPHAVMPGDHRVTAHAEDHAPFELIVHFGAGETRQVHIPALPAGTDTSGMSSGARRTPPQRWIGVAVGSVGLGALIAGAALGGVALEKNSEANKLCPTGPICGANYFAAHDKVEPFAHASTGLLVGGGALAGLGVILFATAPRATDARPTALIVVPSVGPSEAGGVIAGTF